MHTITHTMHERSDRRHLTRTVVLAVAITATLYGVDAVADQPNDDSTGEKQPTTERGGWYGGFGEEFSTVVPLGGLHDLRSVQRSNAPLVYLQPVSDGVVPSNGYYIFAGVGLTKWLDVELTAHVGAAWEVFSSTPVVDTTLSAEAQDIKAHHASEFDQNEYVIAILPRWDVHRWFGVYGRIGVGYADNDVFANLTTEGRISSEQRCITETTGTVTCYTVYKTATHEWDDTQRSTKGFFPVAGIGIDIYKTFRLEYILNTDVPIADTTTDIRAGVFWLRFVNARWADL